MFKGQLFQLLDRDTEQIGIIYTDNTTITENRFEDLWQEYCKEFEEEADDFVVWINNKLNPTEEFPNGIVFERVFTSETFAE